MCESNCVPVGGSCQDQCITHVQIKWSSEQWCRDQVALGCSYLSGIGRICWRNRVVCFRVSKEEDVGDVGDVGDVDDVGDVGDVDDVGDVGDVGNVDEVRCLRRCGC